MKKNLLYSLLYSMIVAVYPIIMIPYLSQVIGKSGVGTYSYTYSIIAFFLLVCQLGVDSSGTRAIAKSRDDQVLMTKTFKSIFFIQMLVSTITIICYLIYIFTVGSEYLFYFLLLLPFLLGQAIRINWFFLGLEQIKTILLRNLVIRLISAVCIFVFVKSKDSLPLYFIIMSGSSMLGDISIWPTAWKKFSKDSLDWNLVRVNIKPMFVMFLPLIALRGSYYIDEIMLGTFHDTDSVGIYENAYKIVNMPLQLYTVFANVLTAQASHLVAQHKEDESVNILVNSIDLSSSLMIPIIFGLIAFAKEFVPWYMGTEFIPSIQVMHILPFILIFSGVTSMLRTQYFIPTEQDNKYVITIFIGVFINITLNAILIHLFTYVGVAVASLLAEAIITIVSVILIQRETNILRAFRYFPLYVGCSLVMSVLIRIIGNQIGVGVKANVIQVTAGILVYFPLLFIILHIFCKKDPVTIDKIIIKIIKDIRLKLNKKS
ncbi:MAG: oligosaccharide flippase family protein [Lachnospiraceae bacterium]|nr:oligosaccharide flippase family protein [Lachnospiraceae bacterium]